MNREEILLKHLDGIHLSDPTMISVIRAMKETEIQYVFEKICNKCTNFVNCSLNGTLSVDEVIDNHIDLSCITPFDMLANKKEVQELLDQIKDALNETKYLWQDNLEETVECIPLHDYKQGTDDDDDYPEVGVKVTDFMPLWERLYKILSNEGA